MELISTVWNRLRTLFSSGRCGDTGNRRGYRVVLSIVVMLISVLFLAYAVHREWDELVVCVRNARHQSLVLSLVLYPLGFVPTALAWHQVMRSLGLNQSLVTDLQYYSLSCLPKRIPGAIWYLSSRVTLYSNEGVSAGRTLVASALETIVLVLTGLVTLGIALLTGQVGSELLKPSFAIGFAGIIVGSGVLVAIISLRQSARTQVVRLLKLETGTEGADSKLNWLHLAQAIALAGAAWFGGGVLLYLVSSSVISAPVQDMPRYIGIWGGAGAVSLLAGFLVQGMGLRELTLVALLQSLMPLSTAVVVALLFRILLTVGEFAWALFLTAGLRLLPSITRKHY